MIPLKSYVLAGDATFTVLNEQTQNRWTFRVEQPAETAPHFVKVLTGQNNEQDYTFFGSIFDKKEFRHGRRTTITPDAPSAQVFGWLFRHLDDLDKFSHVKLLPSEKCCRCGRTLTTPQSVADGIGPECSKKGGL